LALLTVDVDSTEYPIKANNNREAFAQSVKRGRAIEQWERSRWTAADHARVEYEARTQWKGKRGRVDLRLIDLEEGHTVVVEIKATDWDAMAPHRVRPNALRHCRQLRRYIEPELMEFPVLPAIVYPMVPETPCRKDQIESILHERLIQVVWRELEIDSLKLLASGL